MRVAQSFHPCSTTLPRCVCPAPPPQLHPRSSRTPLIPPPPALGCCRTFLPPDPEERGGKKGNRGQGRWEREGQEMCIITLLQAGFRALFFGWVVQGEKWSQRCIPCDLFKAISEPRAQLWRSWDIHKPIWSCHENPHYVCNAVHPDSSFSGRNCFPLRPHLYSLNKKPSSHGDAFMFAESAENNKRERARDCSIKVPSALYMLHTIT